jgi:hypothetical protein
MVPIDVARQHDFADVILMNRVFHPSWGGFCFAGFLCILLPRLSCFAAALPAAFPRGALTVEWQREQTTRLIEAGATYGRMIRLRDGQLLVCYEKARRCWVKSSADGFQWSAPVQAASSASGLAANPELVQLADGRVVLPFNERPRPEDGRTPYTIRLAVSLDQGRTWATRRDPLYAGGLRASDGVWEPAAAQLPDGEIQLFFANEHVTPKDHEQAISLMRSRDGGETWSAPETVCKRPDHRDGMPVPLVLRNRSGIVLAIEDNGLTGTLRFRPAIIQSPLEASWPAPPVGAVSPRRWQALANPPAAHVNVAAPYLSQLPTGETLLSAQWSETSGRNRRMVVFMGDEQARGFGGRTLPFEPPDGVDCLWNSIVARDADTVTALSNTTLRGVHGLWAVDGRVKRPKVDR